MVIKENTTQHGRCPDFVPCVVNFIKRMRSHRLYLLYRRTGLAQYIFNSLNCAYTRFNITLSIVIAVYPPYIWNECPVVVFFILFNFQSSPWSVKCVKLIDKIVDSLIYFSPTWSITSQLYHSGWLNPILKGMNFLTVIHINPVLFNAIVKGV